MRPPGNVLLFNDEVSWRQVTTKLSGKVDESLIESCDAGGAKSLTETVLSKLQSFIWQAGMANIKPCPTRSRWASLHVFLSPHCSFFLIGLSAALEVTKMVKHYACQQVRPESIGNTGTPRSPFIQARQPSVATEPGQ